MHQNIVNTIYNIIKKGTEIGVGQLYTEDDSYNSTTITIGNRSHVNFGSYSYLGLEHDLRLKQGAIEAIQKYGIQYPSSRTYVSTTLYIEFEELIRKIFKNSVVLATTTTLAHIAAMPIVVNESDLIIIDQQVHSSVQFMVSHMRQYGVAFEVLRHNNTQQLESKIKNNYNSYSKIWYMCDGVYSMYGDVAPFRELELLLHKYNKFHLYVDDAHGMSWTGSNGNGFALSKMKLHSKMVLITSLNKAFSAGGAVINLKDHTLADKIRTCGGPMIFAGQHQMSSLGAGIEAAKIHLSNEIGMMQNELMDKITYCQRLLLEHQLPVVSNGESPIFFIGVGLPAVGYNLVERLMNQGIYLNLAIYPAVSETCTGIRFTITRQHTYQQIKDMVETLAIEFDNSLKEENHDLKKIQKAFRKVKIFKNLKLNDFAEPPTYHIQHNTTISSIDPKLWNSFLGDSTFDWAGLQFLEKIFRGNEEHNNWDFHYILIFDKKNRLIFATYLTVCLTKDDVFAPASTSYEIEQIRESSPYYLCSKTIMMGCPLSTGKHYYICDKSDQSSIFRTFTNYLNRLKIDLGLDTLYLRDFVPDDTKTNESISNLGFVQFDLPETYTTNICGNDIPSFLKSLKYKQRYFVKRRALEREDEFSVAVNDFSETSLTNIFDLYQNVCERSFELNLFQLPYKLFENFKSNNNWDCIKLEIGDPTIKTVAFALSYVHNSKYNFLIAGLNYSFVESHDIYSQLLWQITKRAIQLNCKTINMGFTTGQNKRKFGAETVQNTSFIQKEDNYNLTIMQHTSNSLRGKELVKKARHYQQEVAES